MRLSAPRSRSIGIPDPGQLESVYHRAMEVELKLRNIPFVSESPISIEYKNENVGIGRIDLLIGDNQIILELKAADQLAPIHEAQLIAYLKTTGCPLGFLINFNVTLLKNGLIRRVN